MEIDDFPSSDICKLCGNACTLPEKGVDGNLPRILLCAHTYCTICLQSIVCDSVIQCPECKVKSILGERGVHGLNEDDRIIGLIHARKMNKMKSCKSKHRKGKQLATSPESDTSAVDVEQKNLEKVVNVALAEATKKHTQLKHISENLATGVSEQVQREMARLEKEIRQASDKAINAVKKWRSEQLAKLESDFTAKQALSQVQERISTLEIAMRLAREVQKIPSLAQYYTLDKVLETLQAPVVEQSLKLNCVTPDSRKSCIFQSEELNQSLTLSLKFQLNKPKHVPGSLPKICQQNFVKSLGKCEEDSNVSCIPSSEKELPSPQRSDQESLGGTSDLSPATSPIRRPHRKCSVISHNLASDTGNPDIVIEEITDDGPEDVQPPTGPELANNNWRVQKARKKKFPCNRRNVSQWVVVTHIVNPNHFYLQYVAEKKEIEILSNKVNHHCLGDGSLFTWSDTVEIGSLVFAKQKDGLWGRASVVGISPTDCAVALSTCMVTQLSTLRVFFLDYGLTKSITIQSEDGPAESALAVVNSHLRKVSQAVNVELGRFTHQAVKCSLKDLVPYDLAKGWSEEAEHEFCKIVGCSAVEMLPLGEDGDSLLVDLRKAPMDQYSSVPFSVREYLVFIEVARFFSPVTLGMKPLAYYPPVHPKINTVFSAVVSHVNNPADFYIQPVDSMESSLLSTKLQDYYNAAVISGADELNIYCPVIGQACVSRMDDGKWYRAHVIAHPGGRKVEVNLVDFGKKAIVSVSDLRKIKDEFFALPSMAIHCRLSDVLPVQETTWSVACTNKFILANQKKVYAVVEAKAPKGEPLPVKLFDGDDIEPVNNLADVMVNEELACLTEGFNSMTMKSLSHDLDIWDTPLELGSTVRDIEVPKPKTSGQQQEEFDPQLEMLTQRNNLEVRVTHINSPSSFYVQFMQNDSQLQRIREQVEQACALSGHQDVTWNMGMFCAAHINGVWERGQICNDITSSNTVEVRRCDHGDRVKVNICDLRPLPTSLIGSVALECTLDDIRPAGGRSTWTNTACDLFSHYVTKVSLTLTIKELTDERPIRAVLFGCNGQGRWINISDFLIKEGLAFKKRIPSDAAIQHDLKSDTASSASKTQNDTEVTDCPPHAPICVTPRCRAISSAQKIKTSSYHPPELPCLGLLQMNVSAIGDDGLIYARTQCAEVQLQQLKERIQQSLKTLPRQKNYTWKSVLGCAVIGPDMLWYRGQLLEVLGGNVTVQYVDFGLVENIPVVHLYPVMLCEDVPQLCLPCELLGINPVGGKWQQDALALLKEMLVNRSVDVHVVELPADPKGTLKVEIFIDGLSLNKILSHYKHARIDNTVSAQKGLSAMSPSPILHVWDFNTEGLLKPEEPMLGQYIDIKLPEEHNFEIKVKHLHTPNELFIWPVKEAIDMVIDGETLDEALTRINSRIDNQPFLTDLHFEAPCLAEYSDGKYYRAKLINITSVEPVTILVQHVDYGSYDTLPTNKLRQIPAEMLKFPSRALKVKVAGFKASSINRDYDVLPYSPNWSMKATMAMMELLHDNITATVVAREPQLTVELYNEDGELVYFPLVMSGLAEFD